MNRIAHIPVVVIFSLCLAACGTMSGSRFQHIAVSTFYNGQQVDNVTCTLSNKKGSWQIISQGATTIQKGYADLTIACEKEGIPSGFATVKSTTDSLIPNFLIGGAIGSTIDTASESIFKYPSNIVINMGETVLIPPVKAKAE